MGAYSRRGGGYLQKWFFKWGIIRGGVHLGSGLIRGFTAALPIRFHRRTPWDWRGQSRTPLFGMKQKRLKNIMKSGHSVAWCFLNIYACNLLKGNLKNSQWICWPVVTSYEKNVLTDILCNEKIYLLRLSRLILAPPRTTARTPYREALVYSMNSWLPKWTRSPGRGYLLFIHVAKSQGICPACEMCLTRRRSLWLNMMSYKVTYHIVK